MGRTTCRESQCLYKGELFLCLVVGFLLFASRLASYNQEFSSISDQGLYLFVSVLRGYSVRAGCTLDKIHMAR